MIDLENLNWNLEILSQLLHAKRWHGQNIIWAGPFQGEVKTVRMAYEAVRHDVLRLMADNKQLLANETEALDRMKRAENETNLALAKVRAREDEIERLRTAAARRLEA